jgi:hypothetical protein
MNHIFIGPVVDRKSLWRWNRESNAQPLFLHRLAACVWTDPSNTGTRTQTPPGDLNG